MSNQSGKIVLVLVLALLVLGGITYYFLAGFKKSEDMGRALSPTAKSNYVTKVYTSKNLKISFSIPSTAQVKEESININISMPEGGVFVTRNGTNYDDAREYYAFLKEKNHLNPEQYSEGSLGKYSYVSVFDKDANDSSKLEKTYFIYANYAVYIFSTSNATLYPILDQIVSSFEYKP